MSRSVSDVGLAVTSAVMVAFTYQVPVWTGIKSSNQWPIGAAALLMIAWSVVRRRDGFRVGVLLASIVGIGFGLSVASAVHRAQIGRSPVPGLIMLLATIAGTVMYIRAARVEREQEEDSRKLHEELEALKAMSPDEQQRTIKAHLAEVERQFEEYERSLPSRIRMITIVMSAAILLTLATVPLSVWPEPKPVGLTLDACIIVLCVVWLVKFARSGRAS